MFLSLCLHPHSTTPLCPSTIPQSFGFWQSEDKCSPSRSSVGATLFFRVIPSWSRHQRLASTNGLLQHLRRCCPPSHTSHWLPPKLLQHALRWRKASISIISETYPYHPILARHDSHPLEKIEAFASLAVPAPKRGPDSRALDKRSHQTFFALQSPALHPCHDSPRWLFPRTASSHSALSRPSALSSVTIGRPENC